MNYESNLYQKARAVDIKGLKRSAGYSMANDIYGGVMNGLTSYFQAKSSYYFQASQLYNESIPLYQKIGSQVREQMNQQANQYMNAGVDVSQGTAFKVINHTQEQGAMKINEIYNNVETQVRNMKRMSSAQATAGLITGIVSGFNSALNTGFNAAQIGIF